MTDLGYRTGTRSARSFPAQISLACGLLAVLTSIVLCVLPTGVARPMMLCVPIGFGLAGVLTGIVALRRLARGAHRRAERALAASGFAASLLTLVGWAAYGLFIELLIYGLSHAHFPP